MTSEPDDPQKAQDAAELARVDAAVNELSRYYDSVSVFVTRPMSPEDISIGRNACDTRAICRGAGNWFARYGHVMSWLIQEQEKERIEARRVGNQE